MRVPKKRYLIDIYFVVSSSSNLNKKYCCLSDHGGAWAKRLDAYNNYYCLSDNLMLEQYIEKKLTSFKYHNKPNIHFNLSIYQLIEISAIQYCNQNKTSLHHYSNSTSQCSTHSQYI